MARASADMSSSAWPWAISPDSSWAARALTGSAAPSWAARSSAIPRSLRWSATLKPERVVVGDHPAAAVGEDPALRRATAQRFDDLLDVEARPDGQHDALGDAQVRAGEDDLVDGLDRLARTDRSDVGDGLAHGRQHGPGALDVSGVATDEDRERRLLGALAAARDGRIDHRQASFAQARGEVPAARRGDRRAVDDERPRSCPADNTTLTEEDRFHVRRVRHADDDDVGSGGGVRRDCRRSRPRVRRAAGRDPASDSRRRAGNRPERGWRPWPTPSCPGPGRRRAPRRAWYVRAGSQGMVSSAGRRVAQSPT